MTSWLFLERQRQQIRFASTLYSSEYIQHGQAEEAPQTADTTLESLGAFCYSSELSTVAGRKEVSPDSVQQSAHSKFGSFYARTERTFGQLINQEDKKGGLRCFVEDFIEHCFRFLFYVYQDGNYFL